MENVNIDLDSVMMDKALGVATGALGTMLEMRKDLMHHVDHVAKVATMLTEAHFNEEGDDKKLELYEKAFEYSHDWMKKEIEKLHTKIGKGRI